MSTPVFKFERSNNIDPPLVDVAFERWQIETDACEIVFQTPGEE